MTTFLIEPVEETQQTKEASVRPSYAPFFLAVGITMIFWGAVTSVVMSIGGLALLVWALWMWISQIEKNWRN
jgi:hypothetical protein